MRAGIWTLVVLATATPVQAGVYNLAEQHPFVPFSEARNYVLKLRSAAVASVALPSPESFRAQILRQVAQLEKTKTDGALSTVDRINLSGCYLRLGRAPDAVKLLQEERSDHFLLLANLASAYFLTGELEIAARTQERVLAAWPQVWAGWSEPERLHYRNCERYLLQLIESRRKEVGKTGDFGVDPLFPGLRFTSAGKYEAGALSPSMRDRIPADGFQVVLQLCAWYPTDLRLYWLLAESLNVLGQVDQAHAMLDELVENGRSGLFVDLLNHRRALKSGAEVYRELQNPRQRGQLLEALLALTPPTIGGGGGGLGYLIGNTFTPLAVTYQARPSIPGADRVEPGGGVAEASLPFNWMHISVSFGFGFLAAALLGLQVQEWMRWWTRRPAQETPPE